MKIDNSRVRDARALSDSDSDSSSSDDGGVVALRSGDFRRNTRRKVPEDDMTRKRRLDAASGMIDTSCDAESIADESLDQFTYQHTQFKKKYDEIMKAVSAGLPRIDLDPSDDEDSDELPYISADVRDCSPESVQLILNNACDTDCICGSSQAKHSIEENNELDNNNKHQQRAPGGEGREICGTSVNQQIEDQQAYSVLPCSKLGLFCDRVCNKNEENMESSMKFDSIKSRTDADRDTVDAGVRNSASSCFRSDVIAKNSRNRIFHKGRSKMAESAKRLVDEYMSDCQTTLNFNSFKFASRLDYSSTNQSADNNSLLSQGDTGAQPSGFSAGEDCTLIQRLARFAAETSAVTGMNRIDPVTGALRPEAPSLPSAAANHNGRDPVTPPISSSRVNQEIIKPEAPPLPSAAANHNIHNPEAPSLPSSVPNHMESRTKASP